MDILSEWGIWLLVGFVLLMLELIIPGVFVMWWGLAALLVGGISALISLTLGWQVSLFALLATAFSLLWWKYQHNKDHREDKQTDLNARDHHLIGAVGVVQEIIGEHIVRGKFGDTTWKIIGDDLQIGDRVEVQRVEGITLLVRKC